MTDAARTIREEAIRRARERGGERRSLVVPEWRATVYARGCVSVADNLKYHRAGSTEDAESGAITVHLSEVMVSAILDKLEDESGAPAFRPEDRDFLLHEVEADLVSRIYAFVRGEADLSPKKLSVKVG
jgi:hypothetical protein